jgi:excinuclease ABC subunit A
MGWFRDELVNNAYKFDFPIHKPFYELSDTKKRTLWTGNSYFQGLNDFLRN